MSRSRDWRRWRGDVRLAKVLANQCSSRYRLPYDPRSDNSIYYTKKTSLTETIEVQVWTESHYRDYLRHNARLSRDNSTLCSCCWCCNPRKSGIGNSRKVLSVNEGIALMSAVDQIAHVDTPNSNWRSRKFGTSTHLKNEYYDLL